MKMNTCSLIAEQFQERRGTGDPQEVLQELIETHLGAQTSEYKAHVYAYVLDNYDGQRLSAIIAEAMLYEAR